MGYFEEIFYISCSFWFGYLLFKNDIFKSFDNYGIINKDFSNCYILKNNKYAELHNKNVVYKIDVDEFFRLNPKLKGKIKIIEKPEIDSINITSIKENSYERKIIKNESNNDNFWDERKKNKSA